MLGLHTALGTVRRTFRTDSKQIRHVVQRKFKSTIAAASAKEGLEAYPQIIPKLHAGRLASVGGWCTAPGEVSERGWMVHGTSCAILIENGVREGTDILMDAPQGRIALDQ